MSEEEKVLESKVENLVHRGGMIKGEVTLSYKTTVVVGYSGDGDEDRLKSILYANAIEELRYEVLDDEEYY